MKFAVIGHPIQHSLSPLMHNANFKALQIDASYEALNIPEKHFALIKEIIAEKGLNGFNVTIPHKMNIIPYLDGMDDNAKAIGAVNTVHIVDGKWYGYNTDGVGYVKGLLDTYPQVKDARILILGAGGASKGIAYALSQVVTKKVTVANRTMSRFEHWHIDVETVSLAYAESHLAQFDVIINTTPLGMNGNQDVAIDLVHLKPSAIVSDIVYNPAMTPILEQAKQKGNDVYNGLDMFVYQGAESFKIWTQRHAAIDVMRTAVLTHLTRR